MSENIINLKKVIDYVILFPEQYGLLNEFVLSISIIDGNRVNRGTCKI